MLKLENPDFDQKAFLKGLEAIVYLILAAPLIAFGWVFLEKEAAGALRAVFFEDPDLMFHAVMFIGVGYVLMRTVLTWRKDVLKGLEGVDELDVKLQLLRKPIIARNLLWAFGAGIGAYGLYDKGDMIYVIVFTVFLLLMTSNRPSGHYFIRLLKLKGEEKDWMIKQHPAEKRGAE